MRSIRSKISLTFVLLAFGAVVLLGFLVSYEIERLFVARLHSQLETEIQVIESLLKELSVRQTNRESMASMLHAISSSSNLRITLIASDGEVLFESSVPDSLLHTLENHAGRPEVVRARGSRIGSDSRMSKSTGEELLYVALFIEPRTITISFFENLQYIRVAMSLTDMRGTIRDIRLNILFVGVTVLFLALVATRMFSRAISRPIVEIAQSVSDIKAGNLDRRLSVRSQDEIGKLAEVINEMTEKLKQDIEQLKKLERVRSEFLGNVSHELRTPIFSLKGFLETLMDGAIDDPQVNRAFIQRAYAHATRLDTLLADLIEISRIESGEMRMSFRYFDVAEFLSQVREDYVDDAEKKKQSLALELPSREISVYGDKERLRQALGNILDNAVKYTQGGTTIILRAEERDGMVEISVKDNGPGIPAEHLPRIFERFYRVDKNRSRDVGGTGLGLAIVKHIVEAHGGKIHVASEVGKGTKFWFELKK